MARFWLENKKLLAYILVSVTSLCTCFPKASLAQNAIAPDNTLPVNTLVNFDSATKTYTITGGTQAGTNQFHSFQDFSVPTENTTHFNNSLTTTNVIGRVTGSNISNIDGTLRTNGAANLYLVNPNGIIFGANAKLDIAGSFSASTANSIKFSDGSEFSATNPQAPPLLQVNVPLGLQYGNSNAGATIVNRGNLSAGQDLVLNADKLDLQGTLRSGRDLTFQAQDSVKIRDTVTNPFIATSARDMKIQGNQNIDIFVLNNPLTQILSGRNLGLVSDGEISGDAHFSSAGNLSFSTTMGGYANFISKYDPIIYANGDVTFGNYSGASLKIEATGSIQGGDITITSPDTSGAIPVNDPDFTALTTLPSVILRAGVASVSNNIPQTTGGTTFSSSNLGNPVGKITVGNVDTSSYTANGGLIEFTATNDITANSLSSYSSSANAGNIKLTSTNGKITVNNSINASTGYNASQGGEVNLNADGDIITNGIRSDGGTGGKSGDIRLESTTGTININGTINSSNYATDVDTRGGDISIFAWGGAINIGNNVSLNAKSVGSNIAGNITLNAQGDINFGLSSEVLSQSNNSTSTNTFAFSAVRLTSVDGSITLDKAKISAENLHADRDSGDVFIEAGKNVVIKNGSTVVSNGNYGRIFITGGTSVANSLVEVLDSTLTTANPFTTNKNTIKIEFGSASSNNGTINLKNSTLTSLISGNAIRALPSSGEIIISGNLINIDNSQIIFDTESAGNAGTIEIKSSNNNDINITNNSLVSSTSSSLGNSGNIILNANKLTLDNSTLSTSTSGSGIGGSITITAPQSVTISSNGKITAETSGSANGGAIELNTQVLNLQNGSQISASTDSTNSSVLGGNVLVNASTLTLTQGSSIKADTSSAAQGGSLTFNPYNSDQTLIFTFADDSLISTSSTLVATGKGGDIKVTAPQSITLNGNGAIAAETSGSGNGGKIEINTQVLTLDNSAVSASTTGSGVGGSITITAPQSMTISNYGEIAADTSSAVALGIGGNVKVDTASLTLTGDSTLTTSTTGAAVGGAMTIKTNTLTVEGGSNISARTGETNPNATGKGGDISIQPYSGDLLNVVANNSEAISVSSFGDGLGGVLSFSAPTVTFNGSGDITADARGTQTGGSIVISANTLAINTNFYAEAFQGSGNGGDFTIQSYDGQNLDVTLNSLLSVSSHTSGIAGILKIVAPQTIVIQGNGSLKASASSSGNAGNIFLSALNSISIQGIDIDSGTVSNSGLGGNITINTQQLNLTNSAKLSASTNSLDAAAVGGSVFVNAAIANLQGGSQILAQTFGVAKAGSMIFKPYSNGQTVLITFADNSQISTSSKLGATGQGGDISITAPQSITISGNGKMTAETEGSGNSGKILFEAPTLTITGEAEVSAATKGSGAGGSITINAPTAVNLIQVNGVSPVLSVETSNAGKAGNIVINTSILNLSDQARITATATSTSTNTDGGGSITLNASTMNLFGTVGVFAETQGDAPAGSLKLNPYLNDPNLQINLTSGSQISASTSGKGNGGDILLTAPNSITLSGQGTISVEAKQGSSGNAGNISFITPNLFLTNGVTVSASTAGTGKAGDIFVKVNNLAMSNGASIKTITSSFGDSGKIDVNVANNFLLTDLATGLFANTELNSSGKGGDITIKVPTLTITGGAQISAATDGAGAGGSITINAPTFVELIRMLDSSPVLSVQTSNAGKAGNIVINTPMLTLSDQARITATATATATNKDGGGSITLNASKMNLAGIVGVFAETQGLAPAGSLKLNPYLNDPNLLVTLTTGSQISASTSGQGNGGDLILTAPNSITLSGKGTLSVETKQGSSGNAGSIKFTTGDLLLTDGVTVSASTAGTGKAGDISVKVNNFTLSNGASIQTKTSSSGDSGKIEVIVGNNLILVGDGTGLFADTTPDSTGKGGSIFVDPPLVSITNGAGISVNSLGKGNGGNIDIFAENFIFANNAFLRANTASGEGGNINLQIANSFFPRNNSSITATAAGTGNGGNITLSGMFFISYPSENNDIFANAFLGRGGNINITTQGIFGLQFRPRLTPLSDITASSDFGVNGTVNINTPGVDPSKGLTNLPVDIGDASKLVSQKCLADRQGSAFVITGRGGIPASPVDVISGNNLQENVGTTTNQVASKTTQSVNQQANRDRLPDRIVEAQGWTISPQGEVALVAEVAQPVPAPTWAKQLRCL